MRPANRPNTASHRAPRATIRRPDARSKVNPANKPKQQRQTKRQRQVVVGRQSARFIQDGHPWLRPDRYTRGLDQCSCGESITLVDERGKAVGLGLSDPEASIAARVFHQRGDKQFEPAAALQRAWELRANLHQDKQTTTYRIVHAENDFIPGLRVERYGDCFVLQIRAGCLLPFKQAFCAELERLAQSIVDQPILVWREHLDDLRRQGTHSERLDGQECHPEEVVWALEQGVRWPCTPFDGLATGIYVDQRGTREWLRQRCEGKRVLNLFAYSGLFSLSLLQAGAASADDVDLAAPALALGAQAAADNGLSDDTISIRLIALPGAKQQQQQFDIIICDPPTAAQGNNAEKNRQGLAESSRLPQTT